MLGLNAGKASQFARDFQFQPMDFQTGGDAATAGQQGELGAMLMASAMGQGPSVANAQFGQSLDRALQGAQSNALSTSGLNAAQQAAVAAGGAGAAMGSAAGANAIGSAQEAMGAQNALGQLLTAQRGQDLQAQQQANQLEQLKMEQDLARLNAEAAARGQVMANRGNLAGGFIGGAANAVGGGIASLF